MSKAELRAEPRVRVSCRGTLRLGETSAACLIQNMCSRGFLIKFTEGLPVGKVVDLSCDLEPEGTVECKVQVRHVNADCLGAKVIEISDEDQQVCRRFLEAQAARDAGRL
ncbi:MAG TPA: PilZ domain-containing protein [Burkholderiales bacterium]|nr:PilZ domain-containing protein [Burkholderiales bacterium]